MVQCQLYIVWACASVYIKVYHVALMWNNPVTQARIDKTVYIVNNAKQQDELPKSSGGVYLVLITYDALRINLYIVKQFLHERNM